jgi:hypothetical protein
MLSKNTIQLQELSFCFWFLQSVHDREVDQQLEFFVMRSGVLVCWLVGHHLLLLRDLGVIIFMILCIVVTVAMIW